LSSLIRWFCAPIVVGSRKAGFQVAEASEAAAALRRLESAPFDLLISDLKLPKSDGLALFRRLRDKFVDLQFVLLLDAPDNRRAVEGRRVGSVSVSHQADSSGYSGEDRAGPSHAAEA